MSHYRIYFLDNDGRVSRPPEVVEADNDDHAKELAKQFIDGVDIEVWDEARLVAKYPHR